MYKRKVGKGFIDKLINHTPIELHVPGYQYCGPGTRLEKRLERGDPGINPLDQACKAHDIVYSEYDSGKERYEADKRLCSEAWKRVTSKDAKFGERATALGVTAAMKAKMKLSKYGGKLNKFIKNKCFKSLVSIIKRALKGKAISKASISAALKAAKTFKKFNNISNPRVIQLPKTGGALPLVSIFAGLSALGALSGGIANIVKSVRDTSSARDVFEDSKGHNRKEIAIGKSGSGLYLKPYKRGYGLYLKPNSKNF